MRLFDGSRTLPATILCRTPFVFATFFEDLVKHAPRFYRWAGQPDLKGKRLYALFHLGYHYETPPRMEWAKEKLADLREKAPNIEPVFLCNSPIETENFKAIGARAIYASQNAFLHESRYFVTPQKRRYDALYLARITPIKRHELALKVPNLLLIGDYFERESAHARGKVLDHLRADTRWIRKVRGIFVSFYMNQARCGLCLSPEEGAMYVATEYGLCGLPVVTTRCLGGRENALSPQYTYFIPSDNPTQDDVAAAVAHVDAQHYDPHAIRAATIEVLKTHRARYAAEIEQIFKESGEGSAAALKACLNFPHKFGLRCRTLPWFKFFHAPRAVGE